MLPKKTNATLNQPAKPSHKKLLNIADMAASPHAPRSNALPTRKAIWKTITLPLSYQVIAQTCFHNAPSPR